jgi:hypothetical protein
LRGLTKSYFGAQAVADVSLVIEAFRDRTARALFVFVVSTDVT